MRIDKVVDKIASLLAGLYPSESFDVRSPNLPKINSVSEGYPMMITGGSGDYEAYPDVLLNSPEYQIQILVPANKMAVAYHAHEVLAEALVGKFTYYGEGSDSEGALGTVSNLTPNQLTLLDTDSFGYLSAAVNRTFGRTVKDLRYWMSFNFTLYTTTSKNAGGVTNNDGGLFFGNQVEHTITMYGWGGSVSETFRNDTQHSVATATYDQQNINEGKQTSVPQSTAYAKTVTMLCKNTNFMLTLMEKNKNNALSEARFSLKSTIKNGLIGDIVLEDTGKLICAQAVFNPVLGEPLSVTMTLVPATEVGNI